MINVSNEVKILASDSNESNLTAMEIIDQVTEDVTLYGVLKKENEYLVFFFKSDEGNNTYCCKKPYNAECKWNPDDAIEYWARAFFCDPYYSVPGDTTWKHAYGNDTGVRKDRLDCVFAYSPCDEPKESYKRLGFWKIKGSSDDAATTNVVYFKSDKHLYKKIGNGEAVQWYVYEPKHILEVPVEHGLVPLRDHELISSSKPYNLIKDWFTPNHVGYIKASGVEDGFMFALMLQMSVDTGVDFFGYEVNPSDALFIEVDVGNSHIFQALNKIRKSYGIEGSSGPYICNLSRTGKSRLFSEVCETIEQACKKNPLIKLVCIDSFAMLGVTPGKGVHDALMKLSWLSSKYGIVILYTLSDPAMMDVERDEGHDIKAGCSFDIKALDDGTYTIEYWDAGYNHLIFRCRKDAYGCFKSIETNDECIDV